MQPHYRPEARWTGLCCQLHWREASGRALERRWRAFHLEVGGLFRQGAQTFHRKIWETSEMAVEELDFSAIHEESLDYLYIYILYGCSDILYMIYIDYFSVFFHPRWAFWVWIARCFHLFESDPDLSTAMGYHDWQSKYGSKLGPKMHGLNHTNVSGSITVSFKVRSMPKCRSI